MRNMIALLALAVFTAVPAAAQHEDNPECKDSPLLSRIGGCTIDTCQKRDFEQSDVLIGVDESGAKVKTVEGSTETIAYTCPGNISAVAIVRNAENALKAAGFTTVYSGKYEGDQLALTAQKAGTWVHVANTGQDSMTYYEVRIVRTKAMQQEMVSTADAMEEAINRTGAVSLYGIQFDTGKAAIKPESERTLAEIAKLLRKNSAWKMQVEGHTDNVGAKDANMTLSQARAEAVRTWLVANGVDGARLVAKGFGDAKPVGDNATEDGRAKNRRVALVKL